MHARRGLRKRNRDKPDESTADLPRSCRAYGHNITVPHIDRSMGI